MGDTDDLGAVGRRDDRITRRLQLGAWSLYARDDLGGDGGSLPSGWALTVEWQDTPPTLDTPQFLPDGRFQATLIGLPRMTHIVEASTDLVNWEAVSTNTFTGPSMLTIDPHPDGPAYRFFRAIRCP